MAQLETFRPDLWLELGFSADWGEEFINLVRKLEPENYDLANLEEDITTWFGRQKSLFQDLRILEELPDAGAEQQSCTFNVVKHAMECPPLYVGGRVFHLWSTQRGDKAAFKKVTENLTA